MINENNICLKSCSPAQVINYNIAINDITLIEIYNDCNCKYDNNILEYGYSIDGVCWTPYMSYDNALKSTIELQQDFYVRIKLNGIIGYVKYNNIKTNDYSTQLFQGFNFNLDICSSNSNVFNPYANLDCAISLQTQLAETVACMFGIPIYYFKLSPNASSKDMTFKEYALLDVESVKQIKLIIKDGQMPSSKPEFSDFGLDWQTDWETEISKGMFATAFGNKAQPMEGDLIYIPMMKRMWMVNGAYDEKNESLMWNSTTFRVTLVKYQEKLSVDLGDTEDLVNSFVKNKYEDLFSSDENADSGEDFTEAPLYAANNLYAIFESDAVRKYVSVNYNNEVNIQIVNNSIYYKGTLISDSKYDFTLSDIDNSRIVYQKQYCGSEGALSFLFNLYIPKQGKTIDIINLGHIKIILDYQNISTPYIYCNKFPDNKIKINTNENYFVILRWSKVLNICNFEIYKYKFNESIPVYKRTNAHYYFDIDNPIGKLNTTYNIELFIENKSDVFINGFDGWLTNFKLFDVYNDNISELLVTYPTHQHLIINDTARKFLDLPGVLLH